MKMKSSRGVRLITDVIAKRTTTTTTATAKAAAAEPLNYYETQCPHASAAAAAAVAANDTIISNTSASASLPLSAITTSASESFNYAGTTAARPYSEVPGPKPLPIFGNTWRFVLFYTKNNLHNASHEIHHIHSPPQRFYFSCISLLFRF